MKCKSWCHGKRDFEGKIIYLMTFKSFVFEIFATGSVSYHVLVITKQHGTSFLPTHILVFL